MLSGPYSSSMELFRKMSMAAMTEGFNVLVLLKTGDHVRLYALSLPETRRSAQLCLSLWYYNMLYHAKYFDFKTHWKSTRYLIFILVACFLACWSVKPFCISSIPTDLTCALYYNYTERTSVIVQVCTPQWPHTGLNSKFSFCPTI